MWSLLLWSAVPQAVAWTKNYTPCDKAYDKATGKFKTFPAHGLKGGEFLKYVKGTGGLAITEVPDQQLVKVVKSSDTEFQLQAILHTGVAGTAIATITEAAAATLSKGSWIPATRVAPATNGGASVANATTGAKPAIGFSQASLAACKNDGDQLQLIFTASTKAKLQGTVGVTDGGTHFAVDTFYYCQTKTEPARLAVGMTANTQFILYPTGTTKAVADSNSDDSAIPAATVTALTLANGSKPVFVNWNGSKATYQTAYPTCGSPADSDASCAHLNGDGANTTDKPLWNSTDKKCVAGTDAECTKITKGNVWDKTNKKCKAKAASSATRVIVSSAIVAIFGLMA